MPSIDEQKKLGMLTADERWGTGDKVRIKGTKEWGSVVHCEGDRVEVVLDYSITKGSYILRKKHSDELEEVQPAAQRESL